LIQAQQLESHDTSALIMGVMLESNLVEGRQDMPSSGPAGLKYGQSVTDACLSWDMTVPALERLREGVRARRELVYSKSKGLEPLANGVKELKLNDAGGINVVDGH
jgi:3-deoxy-7-phosphoheptulonate synthase